MDDASVKVLCFFKYWSHHPKPEAFTDSIMVHVHTKDQIREAFQKAVERRIRRGWGVGPLPKRWVLVAWLPEAHLTWAH